MNDWRSTFSGVNDHEADWEMITVYLAEQVGGPAQQALVALSSHAHKCDDLRRRGDDPELRRHGDHPVAFDGAGSHSGAFVPGDYVISVDPPQLRAVIAFARRLQRALAPWRDETRPASGFGIPFVDYARGDGVAIGTGGDVEWNPTLIGDGTPWVRDYRGLWGLDTEDPFGGERAPAGPRYERGGSVRAAWANPLGWAGLLKVSPHDDDVTEQLAERVRALERALSEIEDAITTKLAMLRSLRAQIRSLDAHDYARALADNRRAEIVEHEADVNEMIAARTRMAEERRTHLETLSRPLPAEPPQAHIKTPHGPRTEEQERRTRFLRLWAVLSTPLLLAAVIVVLLARPLAWLGTIAVLTGLFVGVEAFARRRFLSFLASTLLLAAIIVVGTAVIVVFRDHWKIAVSVVIGAGALALLIGNVRDLRHGWRRPRRPSDDDRS